MEKEPQLLQVSAQIYRHLTNIPETDNRDEYIEKINSMLDERGQLIEQMNNDGFKIDQNNKSHIMLIELDKGIKERLTKVMKSIQDDLKTLQIAKKNEKQYTDPYSGIQVMDGRYYDKKN